MIRCLEFNDIALKKLVYLYIINYSQTRPDDAIMVINLFCKDVKKVNMNFIKGYSFDKSSRRENHGMFEGILNV